MGNEENTWICTNKSCLAPFLFTRLIQDKTSPLQPKQSSTMQRALQVCWCPCCDPAGASKCTHSLKKWIAMIKENYLWFTLICLVNSHENLANSPCCFLKCLCLRPKLSYSFNPVQEIQDQSWWDFVSSQLFPAPSLEFRQLLVFIPQPWASQIWHFSVNPWFWHELWTGVLSPENSPALQQMIFFMGTKIPMAEEGSLCNLESSEMEGDL